MSKEIDALVADVKKKIGEKGLDAVKKRVWKTFGKMIANSHTERARVCDEVITFGFEKIDPDRLEAVVATIVEAMPAGAEREKAEADLAFWRENRDDIMSLHGITT